MSNNEALLRQALECASGTADTLDGGHWVRAVLEHALMSAEVINTLEAPSSPCRVQFDENYTEVFPSGEASASTLMERPVRRANSRASDPTFTFPGKSRKASLSIKNAKPSAVLSASKALRFVHFIGAEAEPRLVRNAVPVLQGPKKRSVSNSELVTKRSRPDLRVAAVAQEAELTNNGAARAAPRVTVEANSVGASGPGMEPYLGPGGFHEMAGSPGPAQLGGWAGDPDERSPSKRPRVQYGRARYNDEGSIHISGRALRAALSPNSDSSSASTGPR